MSRREFCAFSVGVVAASIQFPKTAAGAAISYPGGFRLSSARRDEDVFSYIHRLKGRFDGKLYRRVVGSANKFKEGDRIVGVCAADAASRKSARALLARTRVGDLSAHPLFADPLYVACTESLPKRPNDRAAAMTLGELRDFVLLRNESEIISAFESLPSDVIGCLVKIMNEDDLIAAGSRLFPTLPGTRLGAEGYLGARIQPNSPTDDPEDVFWQVMSGFSYAVGDVVLGTNPVGSEPESVARLENILLDIRRTFGIEDALPHCVLSHVDIQALIEQQAPGSTGIWFQSLAGSTEANAVFDLTLEKLLRHAQRRTGKYGFYFETGQGSEFTNGHGRGTDMVVLESRKYGLARFLKSKVADAQRSAGRMPAPWLHVNDVAGFIGPEVFRSREQLVRCCLEDIVMGKLHNIPIGLDICSTLHMDVTLDDLDWCMDRIMPAHPAYLMALPTKMDPMLGYLTTSFQDHVRLRNRFGRRVNDAMQLFFQRLGVIDESGQPAAGFGRPLWVWRRYCRAKGDSRPDSVIEAEGKSKMEAVRRRGVPLAEGHGRNPWDLSPGLDREIRSVYHESKKCIWAEVTPGFASGLGKIVPLATASKDRNDYIMHPQTGEILDRTSARRLAAFRKRRTPADPIQIVVSDGLNAYAITDEGNLSPYLLALREALDSIGVSASPELLLVRNGRVRAGYRIGETLFGGSGEEGHHRGIVHIIGERPGSMHHTFSAYITAPRIGLWSKPRRIDHNITRVVSGIASTALHPKTAAQASAKIIKELFRAGEKSSPDETKGGFSEPVRSSF